MDDEIRLESPNAKSLKKEPISDEEKENAIIPDIIPSSPLKSGDDEEIRVKDEPKGYDPKESTDESAGTKITLTVKTTKEKKSVEIDKEASVKELKVEVSKVYKTPIDQICLIFAGKILKDPETLSSHDITEGLILHMVIRAPPKAQDMSQTAAAAIRSSPFGLDAFGGIPGLGNLGFGSSNFMEMQQQMQRELMNNPEFLQQVMDNSFVQSLMANPDCIRQIIHSNPEMKQLMEKNPEIGQMLNNPDVLRQTMEVAKNPAMLQAFMHPYDGASGQSEGAEQGKENVFPLPNPWSGSSAASTTESTPMDTEPPNITTKASETKEPSNTSDAPKIEGPTPTPVPGGLFTSPGLQSIMQQMMQNPQLVQEMLNAPYMQTVIEALGANPEMATQVMINNPVFGSNPQIQDQFKRAFPAMMQQMQNPDYRNFVTNPNALMAMMNIHQGLDQLQQAAPNIFNMFPGQQPYAMNFGQPTADPKHKTDTKTSNESNAPNADAFNQFMGYMVNSIAHQNTQLPPEERYQGELQQMTAMGFVNKEANLQALISTFGDVNAAIERILSPSERLS